MTRKRKTATVLACFAPVLIFAGAYVGRLATGMNTVAQSIVNSMTLEDQDRKLHSSGGCLVEFTNGDDGSFKIDDTHIGGGDISRLGRITGLESSGADSEFKLRCGGDN